MENKEIKENNHTENNNPKTNRLLMVGMGCLGLIVLLLAFVILRVHSSNVAMQKQIAQQSASLNASSDQTPEELSSAAESSSEESSAAETDSAPSEEPASSEESSEEPSEEPAPSEDASEEQPSEDNTSNLKKPAAKPTTSSPKEESAAAAPEAKPTAATLSSGAAVPSVCGALSVNGTQLVDQNGNPVQLRGISTHGLAWFPDYVNADAFKQFRQEWNVNVMRLAMYTHEYGGYCSGGDKEKLKKLVKQGVKYATDNDMYVIIDWHVLQEQNPNTYKSDAKTFFDEMSKLYKGNNNVIYEICNEPNGNTSWKDVKSYAEEIIPVIRANDENAVILVGTPTWSQRVDEAAKDPITGYSNIMYTLHFYAATHKDDLRNTMVNAVKSGLPVFVSEYGICDASGNGSLDKDSAKKWVNTMDQYGISYVCWALANKNESAALLKSSCSKTSGFSDNDLSESGKWLYQTLTGKSSAGAGNADSSGSGNANQTASNGTNNQNDQNNNNHNNNNDQNNNQNNNNNDGSNNAPAQTASVHSNSLQIDAVMKNSWESDGATCYQFDFTLTNTGGQNVGSWEADITFSGNISVSSGWGGTYTANGNTLHIVCESYNGNINAGGSIKDVGCIISSSGGLTVVP